METRNILLSELKRGIKCHTVAIMHWQNLIQFLLLYQLWCPQCVIHDSKVPATGWGDQRGHTRPHWEWDNWTWQPAHFCQGNSSNALLAFIQHSYKLYPWLSFQFSQSSSNGEKLVVEHIVIFLGIMVAFFALALMSFVIEYLMGNACVMEDSMQLSTYI